ncbi:MAG: putative membrane protein [Burkholderiaceae bacterium]|jgi:predicted exporter|nr:MAG: putative membrane protein [Burkholderiaceae bacterium]
MTSGWRRAPAVWLWLAALAVCAVVVARSKFTADLSAFLPKAPTAQQQLLVDQLRDGVASRLILVAIAGANAPTRAALSKALAARLRNDERFSLVRNGEPSALRRDQVFLFEHRYLLSPAVTPAHFSVAGLRQSIADTIDLLASPAGLLVKSILTSDPTGEMPLLLEQLADTAGASGQPRSEDGAWASRDGQRALLLVQTRAPGSDTDGQQQAMAALRSAFDAAQRQLPAPAQAATLIMTGPAVFGVEARDSIRHAAERLSLIGLSLIVALLLFVYRSPRTLLLGLLPVLSGALAGVAAVSLGFGVVHGITLGFGTTLIGEAVDYSIYLFVQSEGGEGGSAARRGWVRSFWPTVRLGVLTSVCGFASLLLSGFPGLAQLGLYAITGLLVAAAVTRFVLPALLATTFRVRDLSALGTVLARGVQRAGMLRWGVVALLVAGVAVLALHRGALWNQELGALSPVPAAALAQDASLRADLGAPDVRYLVVATGATQQSVLRASEAVVAALAPLVQANVIAGVDSPSRFLPSLATQRARQASLPGAAELEQRLREALSTLPLRPDRLAPFVADVEAARVARPIERADLAGTTLALAVGGMLLKRAPSAGAGPRWSALLPLHAPDAGGTSQTSGVIDAARVRQALAAIDLKPAGADVSFVDVKAETNRLYDGYLHQAIVLSLAGLAAIAVLLLIALRSVAGTLRVLAPLAGAVLTVSAALALAGRQLTILHLVGLLLIVAVGSNYALFFNRSAAEPAAGSARDTAAHALAPRTLASLLIANLTTVAGFGVLAFSSVPVLQAIGITVGPGAVLALLFSAVFAARPVASAPPPSP